MVSRRDADAVTRRQRPFPLRACGRYRRRHRPERYRRSPRDARVRPRLAAGGDRLRPGSTRERGRCSTSSAERSRKPAAMPCTRTRRRAASKPTPPPKAPRHAARSASSWRPQRRGGPLLARASAPGAAASHKWLAGPLRPPAAVSTPACPARSCTVKRPQRQWVLEAEARCWALGACGSMIVQSAVAPPEVDDGRRDRLHVQRPVPGWHPVRAPSDVQVFRLGELPTQEDGARRRGRVLPPFTTAEQSARCRAGLVVDQSWDGRSGPTSTASA